MEPARSSLPLLWPKRPVKILRSDVLPEPDGPMIAVSVLGGKDPDMALRICLGGFFSWFLDLVDRVMVVKSR